MALPSPLVGELCRVNSTGLEEFPDQRHLFLRQAVLGMVERGGMTVELYANPIARLVVDFGAELLENVHNVIEVDIGAHRVCEEGVQNFAMAMIHGRLVLLNN